MNALYQSGTIGTLESFLGINKAPYTRDRINREIGFQGSEGSDLQIAVGPKEVLGTNTPFILSPTIGLVPWDRVNLTAVPPRRNGREPCDVCKPGRPADCQSESHSRNSLQANGLRPRSRTLRLICAQHAPVPTRPRFPQVQCQTRLAATGGAKSWSGGGPAKKSERGLTDRAAVPFDRGGISGFSAFESSALPVASSNLLAEHSPNRRGEAETMFESSLHLGAFLGAKPFDFLKGR